MAMDAALNGIRVLDLSTSLAEATGRVLADLGAEVIKIEPPGGCESRFQPPFAAGGEGDPEGSLFWQAFGLGKRSVVLDLGKADDRGPFIELVKGADILIESETPGVMESLGFGYHELRQLNKRLLYVSVTPFGQTGPYAAHPATDLTLSAAGGLMNMQGDGDRPPLPIGVPETVHLGATQAAADVILALYARNWSGRGQHLDTSIQAAVLWSLMYVTDYAALGQNPPGFGEERATRVSSQDIIPGLPLPVVEPCKDGFVVMTLVLGAQGMHGFNAVMSYVGEHGGLDADLMEIEWLTWVQQVQEGSLSLKTAKRGIDQFLAYLKTMTKKEIQEQAVAQKWLIAPAYDAPDLLADPQLAARDFWVELAGSLVPGPFARLSETPIRYRCAAPKLGQDQELLRERPRKQPVLPNARRRGPRKQIFHDLKVADFSWIAAGPLMTKDLANLGATVLRVESEKRIDTLRFIPPFVGDPGTETSHVAANMNQSKLGIALDFTTEKGLEVAYRMVEWADVVVQNFTPGTAQRLGIDYETLRKKKPDLVMLYTCMRGQTGPEARHTGFGIHGAALGGFLSITGWPDRKPQSPWGAYTDFISPRYGMAALGAALYHRDRTGQGQCIDVSQIEASIHYLAPMLLDYQQSGRVIERAGLDSDRGCPHGVYPCAGVERYVAIETRTPEQWRVLCSLVPELSELGAEGRLDALGDRLAERAAIDAALAPWCRTRDAFAQAELLRAAGVPAYVPLRATDFHGDPQLAARGFFIELEHAAIGKSSFDGAVTLFSKTPARPTHAGPTIGQHSFEVMRDILGYSEDEISAIAATGALS